MFFLFKIKLRLCTLNRAANITNTKLRLVQECHSSGVMAAQQNKRQNNKIITQAT